MREPNVTVTVASTAAPATPPVSPSTPEAMSTATTGAVRLMAGAAYRAGAGLVQVAAPENVIPVIQTGLAEATFVPLPQTDDGAAAPSAMEALRDRLADVDAVAVGPGLGRNDDTLEFVRALVRECPVPMVIDADGLTAFAGRPNELAGTDAADLVLTPHAGELVRLAGIEPDALAQGRVGHIRKLAAARSGSTRPAVRPWPPEGPATS